MDKGYLYFAGHFYLLQLHLISILEKSAWARWMRLLFMFDILRECFIVNPRPLTIHVMYMKLSSMDNSNMTKWRDGCLIGRLYRIICKKKPKKSESKNTEEMSRQIVSGISRRNAFSKHYPMQYFSPLQCAGQCFKQVDISINGCIQKRSMFVSETDFTQFYCKYPQLYVMTSRQYMARVYIVDR